MKRYTFQLILCVLTLCLPSLANAQSCSAAASAISFGNVSPISLSAVDTTGTITVTCTWPKNTTTPNVLVCLNQNVATPLDLKHGSNTMQYGLYQDGAYSIMWGSVSNGTTPISLTLTKPSTSTSTSQAVTIYGQITANQPTVPTAGNASTSYTESFSGTNATITYGFYSSAEPSCSSLSSSKHVTFTASATVINDCNINATNVTFAATSVTTTALNATGSITAQCTSGDAWRIALNGGSSGSVTAREMQRSGGGGTISYQLYTNSTHSQIWGDGTSGTTMETGTGTGNSVVLTVYGEVPSQTTPLPGSYSDTITATISF
ncbi:Csu type fimbrial protein [Trinickia acidisoli]|uniref:Csu type fimbrial protein n=1 Tax=Trinickia acidisoli TaxID=2767482 RepID=UPI001A8CDA6A|nr:spore coat protein U domain-containing protein [Trinickia acidisoli]